MIIRQLAAADDLSQAADLLFRFFAEEGFDADRERIAANARTMAALETCCLLVAEEQGRAVGVATVSLEFGIEYGWWAEMGDLYVVPERRGQGISRALVSAAEAFLRERGAAGYQVTVTPHAETHHGLRRFYAALGFDDEGRLILAKSLNER